MRLTALAFALALAACGQSEPPPPLAEAPADRVAPPWFICDAINAPAVLVFERDGTTARVAQYDKPNGALVQRTEYQIGDSEGAAGSVYTALLQNGAEAGHVREVDSGMIETPGAAYTPVYSSVRLGDRDISCRWMPRTRLMGFTGRRTIVVSEDGDGDLLYHSYDFTAAAAAQPVELAENARTTTFSLEVRDGSEHVDGNGARYQFRADNTNQIVITASRNGSGRVDVMTQARGGERVQTEDLIAYVEGTGAE